MPTRLELDLTSTLKNGRIAGFVLSVLGILPAALVVAVGINDGVAMVKIVLIAGAAILLPMVIGVPVLVSCRRSLPEPRLFYEVTDQGQLIVRDRSGTRTVNLAQSTFSVQTDGSIGGSLATAMFGTKKTCTIVVEEGTTRIFLDDLLPVASGDKYEFYNQISLYNKGFSAIVSMLVR
jgi:hypothetical protein